MNLNPSDGHIMDYTTAWYVGDSIGDDSTAFTKDYLNKTVWGKPVNRIAIVRHQKVQIINHLLANLKQRLEKHFEASVFLKELLTFHIFKKSSTNRTAQK